MVEDKWRLKPWVTEPMPLGMTCKPWWKDRLPSKSFPKHKNKRFQFPTSLDSRRWMFVKEGLDDFRKGSPLSEDLIIRGTKEGFLPLITNGGPQPSTKTSRQKPPKYTTSLYSTLSSAQIARKTFMHDLEAYLNQNPSALLSTLEEDVPVDLLLEALKVLDPDRKLEDTWDYCEGLREVTKKPTKPSKQRRSKPLPRLPEIPQPRRYSLLQEDKVSSLHFLSSLPRSYMPQGVRDFCRWVATLGDFGISEDFLLKRFDIGFEFKPTYDDNRMKKLHTLPPELKYCKGLKKVKEVIFTIEELDFERKLQKPQKSYHEKIRYGAWYLKPTLWRKLINDEPLIDPKILAEAQREPPPDIIEDLYGTIAFKDFIVGNGYSMPGILEKLFTRKGWRYDKFVTPIPKAVDAYKRALAAFAQEDD
ncbi:PREDICTED: protein FAM47A-like [Chinchilla lanigera]|uniref:protein FAM47A-like n=1 Tax=Chinchilla lanigera TaxID=34839 RepID=UPI00038F090D|nr:PREDICTED: protein FAM47A-like [Chinchilla lanigera]